MTRIVVHGPLTGRHVSFALVPPGLVPPQQAVAVGSAIVSHVEHVGHVGDLVQFDVAPTADDVHDRHDLGDDTCVRVFELRPGALPAVPSPGLHSRISATTAAVTVEIDGQPAPWSVLRVDDSPRTQVWHLRAMRSDVVVRLTATIAHGCPLIRWEWWAFTQSMQAARFRVAIRVPTPGGFVLDTTASVEAAGFYGPGYFVTDHRHDGEDPDWSAAPGPWFGTTVAEAEVDDATPSFVEWFGFPLPRFADALAEAVQQTVDADRRIEPRVNPNVGGTDPTFCTTSAMAFAPLLRGGLPDPRSLWHLLIWARTWGQHPEWYREPGSDRPIDPPPTHPYLTTHRLQPWVGLIDTTKVPVGKGPRFGRSPHDPQHRCMTVFAETAAVTGSQALRWALGLYLGSELHDRRMKLGNVGAAREEGRVTISALNAGCVLGGSAMMRAINYTVVRERAAWAARGWLADAEAPLRPLFTIDRGVPWDAWTPWEEAQHAAGLYRLYTLTGDTEHAEHAYIAAMNVVRVTYRRGDGFTIPYRVRYRREGIPPVLGPDGTHDDLVDLSAGPDGLFAWSVIALRVALVLQSQDPVQFGPLTAEHRRAAEAIRWADREGRASVPDIQTSVRGAFAELVQRALEDAPPDG